MIKNVGLGSSIILLTLPHKCYMNFGMLLNLLDPSIFTYKS